MTTVEELPPEWPLRKVEELFEVQAGKALSPSARKGPNRLPFLRTINVQWGEVDVSDVDEMHFRPEEVKKLGLAVNDLLVCEGGEIGRSALWNGELPWCATQNHVHRLRALDSQVNPIYYMYWFAAAFRELDLYRGAGNKTTISNLSKGRLQLLRVPFPDLGEQISIAEALSTLDTARSRLRISVEVTRNLKNVLLGHFFRYGSVPVEERSSVKIQETTIGPCPAGWELKQFSEVVEIQKGQVSPLEEPYKSMSHLGPDNVEAGTGRVSGMKPAGELGLRSGKYLFDNSRIIYSKIRPYLQKVALPTEGGICSADMYSLRPLEGLNKEFLFEYLLSPQFTKQAVAFQSRTGIPKINQGELGQTWIPVPDEGTQVEIGTALRSVDGLYNATCDQLEAQEELFRAVLRKLMSGELRLGGVAP